MCGLAGYVGPELLDERRLEACLERMHHRGPDARGAYRGRPARDRYVDLLHTRLSIIDLDGRAAQPLRVGTALIVFNGELYNYREIQARRGWTNGALRTRCDTEVLLRVLVEQGWAGLDACEGMWAFAVYDERDGSLLLGRDRFGEKPMYLLEAGGGLYFASEIKFLAALAGRWPAVNVEHVYRYLVNGYKALYKNGAGFFQGVHELPPGTVMRIAADGRKTVRRYWDPAPLAEEPMRYAEAVDRARAALVRSVALRLRADVPLAFLLSGGIDSNALVGIARRQLGHDVHAFTIGGDDVRYDEREMVEHAVAAQGIRHTFLPLDRCGFLERLRRLVRQHDAPVCTINYYAQWLLMGLIAERGFRITMSGTGADELFSGYYDHHLAYLYELRDDGPAHERALAAWRARIRPVVRNPWLQDPELFIRDPEFRGHLFFDADVFAGFLRRPWAEPFAERRYRPGLLRNRMLNELFHEAVPPILHEDDHNAMAWSMENRSPYLDRELFDLCQRLPTRHLVRQGRAKAVLRDAVRGLVPARILDEPRKVGFNAPIHGFLDAADASVREMVLDQGPIWEHLRRDRIEPLLSRADLPNSRSKFLFSFLNARMFLEEFGP